MRIRNTKAELLLLLLLLDCSSAFSDDRQRMHDSYEIYKQAARDAVIPFTLSSSKRGGQMRATASTYLPDIDFQFFSEKLYFPSQWCEIFLLHLNVKGCSYSSTGTSSLSLYLGSKNYTSLKKSECLTLDFSMNKKGNVLSVDFFAKHGPYHSKNYKFEFNAIMVGSGVYLEIDLSAEPGFVSNLAKIYFLTIGKKKIGFSVDTIDSDGNIVYVQGQRGGLERNLVRYLFAIRAYFDSLSIKDIQQRYAYSLEKWYDHTAQFPAQLYELDREIYISNKLEEKRNQIKNMQSQLMTPMSECTTSHH